MALTKSQIRWANFLYGLGVHRGLTPHQAIEFALGAYHESGLNPKSTNLTSGAAGFFQLLSQGYRDKAASLGGLYNPRANALAILPDYRSYWSQNPHAPTGGAAAAVERSGMDAAWYGRSFDVLAKLLAGRAHVVRGQVAPKRTQASPASSLAPLLAALGGAPKADPRQTLAALQAQSAPAATGFAPNPLTVQGITSTDLYAQLEDTRRKLLEIR